MTKKRGLGRSLEALLTKPSSLLEESPLLQNENKSQMEPSGERLAYLPIDQIQRGKYQPRRDIHSDSLQELAESIRSQGLIQPIIVRHLREQNTYEIIAGERRWRASQLVGFSEIPAIIRDLPDEAAVAMALIENIQRENLNPIEEALALQKLINVFDMTHQQVAETVGKSRTSITNSLRLLSLQEEVKTFVETGQLEMGHARALLSLPLVLQLDAAKTIIKQGLSVRQAERLVRHLQENPSPKIKKPVDPDLKRLQDNLSKRLGLPVHIESHLSGKGKIIIHYNNLNEFDNLLSKLPERES